MEGTTSLYIILAWSRVCVIRVVRWVIVECSRRFWMVVQRKKKWKKINEVHNAPDSGHDRLPQKEQVEADCL